MGNKLAYLLTDGDSFNGYSITGMGISLVSDLYWECQTNLLSRASDYTHLYFALTQAAINLGLSQTQRDNIENACLAVEIASQPAFSIKDGSGRDIVQFRSNGDMIVLRGVLTENRSQSALTPDSSIREFIVKTDSAYLVRVRADTGHMRIKGNLFENQTNLSEDPNKKELVIRTQSEVVAIIDEDGNLKLRGKRWDTNNTHVP